MTDSGSHGKERGSKVQDKTTGVDENYKKYVVRQAAKTLLYVKKGSSPIRSVRINDKSMKEKNRESGRNVLSDVQDFLWSKGIMCYRRERDSVLIVSLFQDSQTLNWFFFIGKELFRMTALLLVMTVLTEQPKAVRFAFAAVGILWAGGLKVIPLTISFYKQSFRGYKIWNKEVPTIFSPDEGE